MAVICHTVVAVALVAAFVLTGNETLLGALVAYIGGGAVQAVASKRA